MRKYLPHENGIDPTQAHTIRTAEGKHHHHINVGGECGPDCSRYEGCDEQRKMCCRLGEKHLVGEKFNWKRVDGRE